MKKTFLTVAVGAMALASASAAHASTFIINNISTQYSGVSGTFEVGNSDYRGSPSPQLISGLWDGKQVSFTAFCIELTQNSSAATFEVVSLASYLGNTTRYNNIAALMSGFAAGTHNQVNDIATQLAVWEARYERTDNQLDVTRNTFDVESLSPNGSQYTNKANILLDSLGPVNGELEFWVAKNSKKQDLLFYTVKPAIPEPATWAMMIIGFAAIGGSMRARRTNTAVSFG